MVIRTTTMMITNNEKIRRRRKKKRIRNSKLCPTPSSIRVLIKETIHHLENKYLYMVRSTLLQLLLATPFG